jgi:hypothetical protein
LKKVISFILLVILTWQFAFKAVYVIYWKINQKEITEKYCEYKQKPELECCGKCHLEKQLSNLELKEESSSEKSQFPYEQLTKLELQAFVTNEIMKFCHWDSMGNSKKSTVNCFYAFNYSFAFIIRFFHPPKV